MSEASIAPFFRRLSALVESGQSILIDLKLILVGDHLPAKLRSWLLKAFCGRWVHASALSDARSSWSSNGCGINVRSKRELHSFQMFFSVGVF